MQFFIENFCVLNKTPPIHVVRFECYQTIPNTNKCEWYNINNNEHEKKNGAYMWNKNNWNDRRTDIYKTAYSYSRVYTQYSFTTWKMFAMYLPKVNEWMRDGERKRNWMLNCKKKNTRGVLGTQIIQTFYIYKNSYSVHFVTATVFAAIADADALSATWCFRVHIYYLTRTHARTQYAHKISQFLSTFVNNFLTFCRVQTSRLSRCRRRSIDLSRSIFFSSLEPALDGCAVNGFFYFCAAILQYFFFSLLFIFRSVYRFEADWHFREFRCVKGKKPPPINFKIVSLV